MSGRVRIGIGGREWAGTVAGAHVRLAGVAGEFTVHVAPDGRIRVHGPGGTFAGTAERTGDHVWIEFGGEVFNARVTEGTRRHGSGALDEDALMAPMAATVVRINVAPGDRVRDGDTLVALEAMKMELPIRAPRDGLVKTVHCRQGELVQQGSLLLELDDRGDEAGGVVEPMVR